MQPPSPPLFLLSGRLTNPLAASLARPLLWDSMLHTVPWWPIGGVSPICIVWKVDRNISLLVGVVWVGISKRAFVRRWLPCSSELIPWIISVTPLNAEQHYSAAAEDKDIMLLNNITVLLRIKTKMDIMDISMMPVLRKDVNKSDISMMTLLCKDFDKSAEKWKKNGFCGYTFDDMVVQSLQKLQRANSQPCTNSKLVTKYVQKLCTKWHQIQTQIQIVHKLTSKPKIQIVYKYK